MKNRLANITTAIRGSRTAQVALIIGALWVTLLLGFFGGSRMTAKTQKVVTLNPRPSAVRSLRKHRRTAGNATPGTTGASSLTVPCPVPTEGLTRNDQKRGPLPGNPSEHEDRQSHVRQDPDGQNQDGQNQDGQNQDRYGTASPVVPYAGTNPARAVVRISVPVSPYRRRTDTRVAPVEGINISLSPVAPSRSEPGLRPFRGQVATGKQISELGFQPFRH